MKIGLFLSAVLISLSAYAQPQASMPLFNRDSKHGKASKGYKKGCKVGAIVGAILGGFILGVTNLEGDDDIPNMGGKDAALTMGITTGLGCGFGMIDAGVNNMTIYENFVWSIRKAKSDECIDRLISTQNSSLRCRTEWDYYDYKRHKVAAQIIAQILTNSSEEIQQSNDPAAVREYVLTEIGKIEANRDGL